LLNSEVNILGYKLDCQSDKNGIASIISQQTALIPPSKIE